MAKKQALQKRRLLTARKGLLSVRAPNPRGGLRGEIRIDHEGRDIEADDSDHECRNQGGCSNQGNPFVEVQLREMQRVFMVNVYVVHENLQPSRTEGMA